MKIQDIRKIRPESDSEADRRAFVERLYRELLRRPGERIGVEAHCAALAAGMPPIGVIEAFLTSSEFLIRLGQETLAAIPTGSDESPDLFPLDFLPAGESGLSYVHRIKSGFLPKYCGGPIVLDIGYTGYENPEGTTAFPHAIGIDLDTPGYDGLRLPYDDLSVDTVFSSHALEHFTDQISAIQEWFRVLKTGGFIVCMVPSQALYEKKLELPSRWNGGHMRMYTPANLAAAFEEALEVNSYRLRHLRENDMYFDYSRGPDLHSGGAYEIEIVVEKIAPPDWKLA